MKTEFTVNGEVNTRYSGAEGDCLDTIREAIETIKLIAYEKKIDDKEVVCSFVFDAEFNNQVHNKNINELIELEKNLEKKERF